MNSGKHILSKVCICAIVIITSCNEDPAPLIQKYSITWEQDLSILYNQPTPFQPTSNFHSLHINPDGSMYVFHNIDATNERTLILLNAEGEFLDDLPLDSDYHYYIGADGTGNMITSSYDNDNQFERIVNKWGDNLNKTHSQILTLAGPYYQQFHVEDGFYYVLGSDATNPDFRITKYNWENEFIWTKPLGAYSISGWPQLFFHAQMNEMVLSSFDGEGFSVAKLNPENGNLIWTKSMSMEYASISYLSTGDLIFSSVDGTSLHLTRVNSIGNINLEKEVVLPFVGISGGVVLEESDGGFLSIASSINDAVAFRILKMDSQFNIGWIGEFRQLNPGYISGIRRTPSGQIIVLTSNGYLYALSPN